MYPAVVDRCFPIACGIRKEKKRGRAVIDLKYNEIQIESRHMTIKVKDFKLNVILQKLWCTLLFSKFEESFD